MRFNMRELLVLLAMLAILRKLIILDLSTTSAEKLFALSAAVLALGVVYWIVRRPFRPRGRRDPGVPGDAHALAVASAGP